MIRQCFSQETGDDTSVIQTSQSAVSAINKAIEVTQKDLLPKLTKEAVTDLVLVSMWFLPKSMPSTFQETFTPIAAAGGAAQVNHLARLLATQLTNAGIGPGIDHIRKVIIDSYSSILHFSDKLFAFLYPCDTQF